jgi:hypothetical protein
VLLFTLTTIISCSENEINLNEEFQVSLSENIAINNKGETINLKFDKVLEYSLCPENMNCIWAGRVRIEVKLNNQDTITLGILDHENPSKITYQNYEITLVNVTPIIQGETANYNATFIVKEIEL